MNKKIIESGNVMKAGFVNARTVQYVLSFYAVYSQAAYRVVALFWSVFGPAARYNFRNPEYAYAASLKP